MSGNKKTEKSQLNTDIPLLSDHEKRELVSLVKDKNISMDFILEMKEAFLLFDKVTYLFLYIIYIFNFKIPCYDTISKINCIKTLLCDIYGIDITHIF